MEEEHVPVQSHLLVNAVIIISLASELLAFQTWIIFD